MHVGPKEFGDKSIHMQSASKGEHAVENAVWVYCEGLTPKSAEGRLVALYMSEETATQFLLQLKRELVELRSAS